MQGCVKGTVLVSSLTLHNTIKAACAVLSADNDFLKLLLKNLTGPGQAFSFPYSFL